MAPSKGDIVGSFALVERTGQGGFGEVWIGRHREWPDKVEAFKFPVGDAAIARLKAEGETLATLEHEHIVKVADLDTRSDPPHLRMEYVAGCSLEGKLREGALPVKQAERIFLAVCRALAHAHGRGVVHRDVKPGNILLGNDGAVKLGDFGLAVLPESGGGLAPSLESMEGRASVAGTLEYMAPEVKDGEDATPASDVYSLGRVLYQMLTGRRELGLHPPSHDNPDVPDRLDALVERMVAVPDERPRDAGEALALFVRGAVHDGDGPGTHPREAEEIGSIARQVVFSLSVFLATLLFLAFRVVTPVLSIPLAILFAAGAIWSAPSLKSPLSAGLFWSGLAISFYGGRWHWALLVGGIIMMVAGTGFWAERQVAALRARNRPD